MLSLAEVAVPRRDGAPVKEPAEVVADIEDFVGRMSPLSIRGIRAMVLLFEFLALFVLLGLRPFTRLTRVEKEKYLRDLYLSRFYVLRSIPVALNGFLQLVTYSNREVAKELGFDLDAHLDELRSP